MSLEMSEGTEIALKMILKKKFLLLAKNIIIDNLFIDKLRRKIKQLHQDLGMTRNNDMKPPENIYILSSEKEMIIK